MASCTIWVAVWGLVVSASMKDRYRMALSWRGCSVKVAVCFLVGCLDSEVAALSVAKVEAARVDSPDWSAGLDFSAILKKGGVK